MLASCVDKLCVSGINASAGRRLSVLGIPLACCTVPIAAAAGRYIKVQRRVSSTTHFEVFFARVGCVRVRSVVELTTASAYTGSTDRASVSPPKTKERITNMLLLCRCVYFQTDAVICTCHRVLSCLPANTLFASLPFFPPSLCCAFISCRTWRFVIGGDRARIRACGGWRTVRHCGDGQDTHLPRNQGRNQTPMMNERRVIEVCGAPYCVCIARFKTSFFVCTAGN